MKKILLVIDAQNDFITGSLKNEEAIKKVPNIVKKIHEFYGNKIYVTMDTHNPDYLETNEGKKLPVEHCIKYTEGWCINKNIKQALDEEEKNGIEIEYIEKPTFGSFELIDQLTLDGRGELEFEVEFVGFCTDICVVSNVLMTKAALYNKVDITVDASCCAGVTPESHNAALLTMKMCQINVVNE